MKHRKGTVARDAGMSVVSGGSARSACEAEGEGGECSDEEGGTEDSDGAGADAAMGGLQKHAKREENRARNRGDGEELFDVFRECDVIEGHAEDDQKEGQADPMAVHVHHAIVNVFGFAIERERGPGFFGLPLRSG